MAITVSDATYEPKSTSRGPVRIQIVELVINSGSTSGTLTASRLKDLFHVVIPGLAPHTAAPTYSNNVATLAFTVPIETAASQTKGGVTITSVANAGSAGNNTTLAYTTGAVAGSEVVTVVGQAISVQIESEVSTITQVRTAINARAAAAALVTATGTSATDVSAAGATSNTGGVSGGFRGSAICIGR